MSGRVQMLVLGMVLPGWEWRVCLLLLPWGLIIHIIGINLGEVPLSLRRMTIAGGITAVSIISIISIHHRLRTTIHLLNLMREQPTTWHRTLPLHPFTLSRPNLRCESIIPSLRIGEVILLGRIVMLLWRRLWLRLVCILPKNRRMEWLLEAMPKMMGMTLMKVTEESTVLSHRSVTSLLHPTSLMRTLSNDTVISKQLRLRRRQQLQRLLSTWRATTLLPIFLRVSRFIAEPSLRQASVVA
mmetsp:Transcript_16127/g.34917  ORF Transcript_16127/g.34917 Transcript_16127/m.34917 type:complete len:242 (+) Transcript_16127:1058-1783(+)